MGRILLTLDLLSLLMYSGVLVSVNCTACSNVKRDPACHVVVVSTYLAITTTLPEGSSFVCSIMILISIKPITVIFFAYGQPINAPLVKVDQWEPWTRCGPNLRGKFEIHFSLYPESTPMRLRFRSIVQEASTQQWKFCL